MSKAFTSEETEDVSVPGRAVVRSAPGEERPITPAGFETLTRRRDALREERAGATGDRAKELDHRLALVLAALEDVRVVVPERSDPAAVQFGSEVTLRWEDGRIQRVTLVGPDEAEGDRISIASPLGRALLGARVGASVEIERPKGATEATVLAIA